MPIIACLRPSEGRERLPAFGRNETVLPKEDATETLCFNTEAGFFAEEEISVSPLRYDSPEYRDGDDRLEAEDATAALLLVLL